LGIESHADHVGGFGKRGFNRPKRAVLVFHREIAGYVRVQLGSARCQCILSRDRGRQIAVSDGNALYSVLGGSLGLGHDQSHRLADEAHALMRQRMPVRHLERAPAFSFHEQNGRRRLETGLDDVFARKHSQHSRNRQCGTGIDGCDFGVGMITAQEGRVRLTVEVPIRGILAFPGDKTKIFAPSLAGRPCVHWSTRYLMLH
jgi:hypothetical protein